jgi:hypothetical protein
MVPEISKLNWSYERPKFKDVEGKTVVCEYSYLGDNKIETIKVMTERNYNLTIDIGFVRYAIIDISEDPLPLNGTIPNFGFNFIDNNKVWFIDFVKSDMKINIYGTTKEEAVSNWNKFVRRIK